MKKTLAFISLSLLMTPVIGADTSLSGNTWNTDSDFKKSIKQPAITQTQQDEMDQIATGNLTGKQLTAQQLQDEQNKLDGARSHANNMGNANRTSTLKVDANGQTKILQYNGVDVYEFEVLPVSKGKTAPTMIPLTEPYKNANGTPKQIYVLTNGNYTLRNQANPSAPVIYNTSTKQPIMIEKLVPVYDRDATDAGTSVKNNQNNANSMQGQMAADNKLEKEGEVKPSDRGSGGAKLKYTKLMQGLTIQADYQTNVYSGFKWHSAGINMLIDKVDMSSLAKVNGSNVIQTLYGKMCIAGLQGGLCECDPNADYAKKDPNFCTNFDNAVLAGEVWKNVTLQNNGSTYKALFDTMDIDFTLKCQSSTTNKNTCDISARMTADNRIIDAGNTTSPIAYGGDNAHTDLTNVQQSSEMTSGIQGSASVLKKCMNNAGGAIDNPDPNSGNVSSFDTCGTEPEFQKTIGSPAGTQADTNGSKCVMKPKNSTTKSSSVEKTCNREWDAVYYTCTNQTQNTVCATQRTISPLVYKCQYTTVNTVVNQYQVTAKPQVDAQGAPVIDPKTGKQVITYSVATTKTNYKSDSGCEAYRDEKALGFSEPDIFACTLLSSTQTSSVPSTVSWGGPTPPNNGGNQTTTTSKFDREYQCYDRNVQNTDTMSGAYCNATDLIGAVKIDDGEKIWMFSHPGKTQSECQQTAGNYKVGCVSWERAFVWPSKVITSNCNSTALNNPKVTSVGGPVVTSCINGGLGEVSNCAGWFRRKNWKLSWDMSSNNQYRAYYGAGCYLSYTDFDVAENTTLNIIHHISQMDGSLGDKYIGNANGCGYCTTAEVTDICYGDRALDRGTCANEIDPLLAGSDPKTSCVLVSTTPNRIYKVAGKTGVFAQTETYKCTTSESVVTEWEKVCPANTPLDLNQGITKGTDKVKQPVVQEDSNLAQLAVASEMVDAQAKSQKQADPSDLTNRSMGSTGSPPSQPMGDIKPVMFKGEDMRCEFPGGSLSGAFYNDCCSVDLRRTGGKKMFGKCNEGHVKLAANRRAKRTVEIGTRCSIKKKYLGCIERQKTFCSFDSMFSRILQEQGRIQLNKIVANAVAGIQEKQVQVPFYTPTPGGMTDAVVDQIYAGDLVVSTQTDKQGAWIPNLVSLSDENISFFKWPWYCSKESWKKLELLDGFGSCPSDLTLYMARCSKNCTSEPLPVDPFANDSGMKSPFSILTMNAINNDIKAVTDKILIAGGCNSQTAMCDLSVKVTKPTGAQAYTYKTLSWDWSTKDDANALIVSNGQTAATGGQVLEEAKAATLSDKMNNMGDYLIRPYVENYTLDPNNLPKTVKIRFSYDAGTNWQDITLPTEFDKEQVLVSVNQLGNTTLSQQEIALGSAFAVVSGGCKYESNSCAFRVKALITVTGKSWGNESNPDCSGLTPTQVSVLDINAMDLSEWQQDIMTKMRVQSDSFSDKTKQTQIQNNLKAQTATFAGVFDKDIDKVSVTNNENAYTVANSKQTQVANINNRELWIQTGNTETVSMRIAGNYPQWNPKPDGTMNIDQSTKELIPNDPINRVEVDWGDCSVPTTTIINENTLSANATTREQQIQSNIVKVKQVGANLPMNVAPKDAATMQNEINKGNYYIGAGFLTAHTYASGVDWLNVTWPATCVNKPTQKKAATDNYQANIYYWEVPVTIKLWTKSSADKAALFGRAEQPYEITALIANYQDDLVEKHNVQGDTQFRLKDDSQDQQANITGSDTKKAATRDQYKEIVKPYTCQGPNC